eukprot:m.260454 g.260454  ORF g.260454 m.260454 type:complete len:91 (-) comp54605_c1_seq6:525-797(-)
MSLGHWLWSFIKQQVAHKFSCILNCMRFLLNNPRNESQTDELLSSPFANLYEMCDWRALRWLDVLLCSKQPLVLSCMKDERHQAHSMLIV